MALKDIFGVFHKNKPFAAEDGDVLTADSIDFVESGAEVAAPVVKTKDVNCAFDDTFVMGSQIIDKKSIMSFIRGKTIPVTGTEFYFAYTYENGRLNYIATRCGTHVTGQVTVFAPVFFSEGKFVYKSGPRYFIATNTAGALDWSLDMAPPPRGEYTELNDEGTVIPSSAQKTIYFQWSLHTQHFWTDMVLAVGLLISLIYYGQSLNTYNSVQKRADDIKHSMAAMALAPKPVTKTMDLSELINETSHKISVYDGTIAQIKIDSKAIVSYIKFPSENFSRMFLDHNPGGKYEDGKVLLGFSLTPDGDPNAGGKGGEKQKGGGDSGKPADPKAGEPGEAKAGPGK